MPAQSRIRSRFVELRKHERSALIVYVMGGDPDLETTRSLILELERAGADVIELGVPFTDPLADGPSIQAANERALADGTTLNGILELVRDVRRDTEIPILLMTYYNPIFRAGQAEVAQAAREAGVDGMLITDLPPEEAGEWKAAAQESGLDTVFLLAPTSTDERIRIACDLASGFVYCVSRTGVTGARADLPEDLHGLLDRIRARTDQPVAVGVRRLEAGARAPDWGVVRRGGGGERRGELDRGTRMRVRGAGGGVRPVPARGLSSRGEERAVTSRSPDHGTHRDAFSPRPRRSDSRSSPRTGRACSTSRSRPPGSRKPRSSPSP